MPSRPILLPWIPLWTTISVASPGCWFVPQIQFAAQGSCDSLRPMRQKYAFAHLLSLGNHCVSWGLQLFKRVIHHFTCQSKNTISSSNVRLYPAASLGTPRQKTTTLRALVTTYHPSSTPSYVGSTWDMSLVHDQPRASQPRGDPEGIQEQKPNPPVWKLQLGSFFFSKLEDEPPIFLGRLPPFWNFWAEWVWMSNHILVDIN